MTADPAAALRAIRARLDATAPWADAILVGRADLVGALEGVRQEERAAVVAWLRAEELAWRDEEDMEPGDEAIATTIGGLVEGIVRGEHADAPTAPGTEER